MRSSVLALMYDPALAWSFLRSLRVFDAIIAMNQRGSNILIRSIPQVADDTSGADRPMIDLRRRNETRGLRNMGFERGKF